MNSLEELRQMSSEDFLALGVHGVAYVRTVKRDGEVLYGVYGADGSEMAVMDNRDLAFVTIRQNGLEALSAH